MLDSIIMQKIKKIYGSISEKMSKPQIFLHLTHANPWINIFETGHIGQMLNSVGLYHHAKKMYVRVSKKMSKKTIFYT